MLWRLPWIIGKSPLSISVYLYVWYVRQSSSVESPLASPLRHDVSRARSFTVTTNEGYILPSSFQMLTPHPPTHMVEYFFRDLKTFPHGIEQYMRGRFFITWTVIPTQLILLSDVNSWDGGGKLQLRGDIGADHPRGGQPHQLLCVGQFCLFYFPLRPLCLGAQHKISFYQV